MVITIFLYDTQSQMTFKLNTFNGDSDRFLKASWLITRAVFSGKEMTNSVHSNDLTSVDLEDQTHLL